jgi:hypothetical protein
VRRLVVLLALALAGFATAAVLRPGSVDLALDALVLFCGAVLVLALAGRVQAAAPPAGRSSIEAALDVPALRPARPVELERIERRVVLGVTHAGDFHASLLPQLRRLAMPLLAARGVDLDHDPEAARALLGDDACELLRPGRPRPADPFAPGVPAERLAAVVDALEGLAR